MTKKYLSFINITVRALKIQLKVTPVYIIGFTMIAFLESFGLIIRVKTIQRLFEVITAASMGELRFADCLAPLFIMAVVTFVQQIMNGLKFFFWTMIPEKSCSANKNMLFQKLQNVNAERFEDTSFLDDVNKATEGVAPLTTTCLFVINLVFFSGTYAISMGVYLYNLRPILLFSILIAFLPALLTQIVRIKIFTKLENENAPLRREYDYYKKTMCDRQYYKETRILGAYNYFYKLFMRTMILFTHKQWQVERRITQLDLLLNIVSFTGMGLSTFLLFLSTLNGTISVGAFAAIFAALGQIFDIMQSVMRWDINGITREVGKVTNFFRILDLPERTGIEGTHNFTKGIVVENVSFIYPGRDEHALSNVSLTITDGETIAIVGENGSGKSTLVRLLTGMYTPSEGRVLIGGLDTIFTAPSSIYYDISGVFQEYQRYKMTLFDNVIISNTKIEHDKSTVEEVLKDAGFKLDVNNIELDTMLSPEFEGIELSGGQWQRLAIARGLYRRNNFIVLDEPTAAIDPLEENMIFTQFKKLIKGKCAVLVTHRLGPARLANRIIVMDAGEIIDVGTHEELLSRPGKYADMWAAQVQWYER